VGAPRCPHCSSKSLVPEEALAGLMPSLTVCCANEVCPAEGVQRRVGLTQVVPGVLDLPRLVCARCGYELLKVTEDIVPKITVHGGPSNAAAEPEPVPANEAPEEQPTDAAPTEDGEQTEESPETADKAPQPRSRTSSSRSKKTRAE
jgi:DNA-directed RNA polymerase subunit RPC12/RpoP